MHDFADVLEGSVVRFTPWKELPPGASRVVQKIKERRSIRRSNDSDEGDDETIIDVQMEIGHYDKLEALRDLIKLKGFNSPAAEDSDKLNALIAVLKAGPVKRNSDGA